MTVAANEAVRGSDSNMGENVRYIHPKIWPKALSTNLTFTSTNLGVLLYQPGAFTFDKRVQHSTNTEKRSGLPLHRALCKITLTVSNLHLFLSKLRVRDLDLDLAVRSVALLV